MTFAEYNTDENFNNDKSSLDELVKIGLSEGKTSDEIKSSLSPKWQKSKKIGEFDSYVSKYSTPKAEEEKPAEKKVVETTTQTTAPKVSKTENLEEEKTGIKTADLNYMNDINAILNEEQKKELQKYSKTKVDDYNRTMETMERSGEAFKQIDDHMVEQLPTFMFKRYQNGEFGDPKSSDAKLRLAHFMINGVQSKLKNVSNAAMIAAGKSPMFSDTMSDYEKYQQSNLAKGMENRWKKYQEETNSAIAMVQNRNVSEEEALNIINKISMNNRLQNAYNMADANKKAYMIEVLSKIGDKVSNWNDKKFINALVGAEITGESVDSAAALIGARAGEKVLGGFNLIDENGNIDLSALKEILKIPGTKDKLKDMGIDVDNIDLEGDSEPAPTVSKYGTVMEDGTVIDPGRAMGFSDYNQLKAYGDKLSDQYYNGEINEAKFRSEYAKLEKIMNEHGWFNFWTGKGIKNADDLIRVNNNENLNKVKKELDNLNKKAKNGEISTADYVEKFNDYRTRYQKWGADEKALTKFDKEKLDNKTILKAIEKKNKKK